MTSDAAAQIAMKIRAYPKMNLSLDVVSKRQDGYHELKSVFCLGDIFEMDDYLYDTLDIKTNETKKINISVKGSDLSCGPDNLVYKAANALIEKYGIEKGVDIVLEKRIPSGAGLGGGSSDAASTLMALNELFELKLSDEKLIEIAAKLGADVPFFIKGGTVSVSGIGEILIPVKNVPKCHLMIVKPKVSVPTAEAYGAVDEAEAYEHPDVSGILQGIEAEDYEKICALSGNSFEQVIFSKHPSIEYVKNKMICVGADCATMTGSGSAVFALFRSREAAERAAVMLKGDDEFMRDVDGVWM